MKKRRVRILGDELKGRGLFLKVAGGRLTRDFPDGAAMPGIGGQVRVFTKGSGHGSRHVYWPADRSIPERLRGEEWQDRGTWEVRFADRTGANITLWRDYTVEERQAMGEMLDARYTIGKTFMLMANDIAAGKFFRDIADNPDWSTDEEPAAPWKDAGDYGRFWTDRSDRMGQGARQHHLEERRQEAMGRPRRPLGARGNLARHPRARHDDAPVDVAHAAVSVEAQQDGALAGRSHEQRDVQPHVHGPRRRARAGPHPRRALVPDQGRALSRGAARKAPSAPT